MKNGILSDYCVSRGYIFSAEDYADLITRAKGSALSALPGCRTGRAGRAGSDRFSCDHAPNHTGLVQAICPFSWVTRR